MWLCVSLIIWLCALLDGRGRHWYLMVMIWEFLKKREGASRIHLQELVFSREYLDRSICSRISTAEETPSR